jgi:hypothetical protein
MRVICGTLALLVLVSNQVARAGIVFGEPTLVPVEGVAEVANPQVSHDGLELYFASREPGQCYDIWVMTRPSVNEDWGTPVRLEAPLNSPGLEITPCISPDGLELYFSDEAFWVPNCQARAGGYGKADIWVSRRSSKEDSWGVPENVGPMVNTAEDEGAPSLSADGLSLYFNSSIRADGYGAFDVYVSTRTSTNDPWGLAQNLGATVNTEMSEATPIISPDGLSLFFSMGPPALPESFRADLYVSRRASLSDAWGAPALLEPLQVSGVEFSASFCDEDATFYFSNSAAFLYPYDLLKVEVTLDADFNDDGTVDVLDVLVLTENWGVVGSRGGPETALCDIAPFPLSDGVVDAKDLAALAKYMIENTSSAGNTNDL